MLARIEALGRDVLGKWEAAGFDGAAFPAIAQAALAASRLHLGYDTAELARLLSSAESFPEQSVFDSQFGEPPLTLYMDPGRRMAIEVYLWLHTDTSMHDHSFAGACTVLQGKSLHVTRKFDVTRTDGELSFGNMQPGDAALLRPGDVFPIFSGGGFIHQVCHLSEPTVSLVVRTICDLGIIQRDYFPPHFSLPPRGQAVERRMLSRRMLATLRAIDPVLAETFETDCARRRDPAGALLALRDRIDLGTIDELEAVLPGARSVAIELAAQRAIVFETLSEEGKLFAALLLSVGFSETMYRVLREYHGGNDPRDSISAGLNEIASSRPPRPCLIAYALARLESKETSELSGMDREIARLWKLP